MTPQEALQVVNQALGLVVANRATHIEIQNAFKILELAIMESEKKENKQTKTS